jgi:heme-degrading monooxygenase HmoA
MNVPCYIAVWEFQVKPEKAAEFEEIYGPEGAWAQLFRRSASFLGANLLCDLETPGRYLTLDRWISRDALRHFKQIHHNEYSTLDKHCEGLTVKEVFIGDFQN